MPALGWKRDLPKLPGEQPDHDAAKLLASTAPPPPSASNRALIVDVLDQLDLGSCVANAISQAVRASQIKQGVSRPRLASRLFGYWTSRAFHHSTETDDGTYLRTYFQALNKFGFCPEEEWPYDVSRYADMPSTGAFRAAFDQASPTVYKRIQTADTSRVNDIKHALANGYLVCFGTLVSEDFARNSLGTAPLTRPTNQPIAGGHALCLVGYDGDTFDVVNSWSADWGDKGYCKFSSDYLRWSESSDFWLVETAPEYNT